MKREFTSRFTFGNKVCVKFNDYQPAINGTVDAVRFTESKVYYDIYTDYVMLEAIDSNLVGEVVEEVVADSIQP